MSTDPTPIPAEARQAARRAYHAAHLLAESPVDRAIDSAFAAGLAAGRTAAAADIRDAAYPDPSPCIPAWHAGYTEAWQRAARVAENGADHV